MVSGTVTPLSHSYTADSLLHPGSKRLGLASIVQLQNLRCQQGSPIRLCCRVNSSGDFGTTKLNWNPNLDANPSAGVAVNERGDYFEFTKWKRMGIMKGVGVGRRVFYLN